MNYQIHFYCLIKQTERKEHTQEQQKTKVSGTVCLKISHKAKTPVNWTHLWHTDKAFP